MDKRKVRRMENVLFRYFGFDNTERIEIRGKVFTLKHEFIPEIGMVRLYINKVLFFQTGRVIQLKQMLKLLVGF